MGKRKKSILSDIERREKSMLVEGREVKQELFDEAIARIKSLRMIMG